MSDSNLTLAIDVASKLLEADPTLLSYTQKLITTLEKTDNKVLHESFETLLVHVSSSISDELKLTCWVTDKFDTDSKDLLKQIVYKKTSPEGNRSMVAWWYTENSIGNQLEVVDDKVFVSISAPSVYDSKSIGRIYYLGSKDNRRIVIKLPISTIKEMIKKKE